MPLTYFDIALLVVMLMSGLLAMVRGLMRELFSIGSWIAAAGAAYVFYPKVLPITRQYISHDTVALAASAAAIFFVTLLVVWIITSRISDMILDSRIGALDRSLGFVFGLARGLVVMVVAFLFLSWLMENKQPSWVTGAKSYAVMQSTGEWLKSLLPDDPEEMLRNLKRSKDAADPGRT